MIKPETKRTQAEWDRFYEQSNSPTKKEMTEKEYLRAKYLETVKRRFGKVKNVLLSAFTPAPSQDKKGRGKPQNEMAERFDYISNPFGNKPKQ